MLRLKIKQKIKNDIEHVISDDIMQGSQELPVCSADNTLVRNQLTPIQGIECLDVLIWNSTVATGEMEFRWIRRSRQVKD